MNQCLSERVLLQIYMREGLDAQRSHLRLCADCAERYDHLTEDLETIGQVLEAPPLHSKVREVPSWRQGWIPAAATCMALIVLALGITRLRQPPPVHVAQRPGSFSAFAKDLSTALFATADVTVVAPLVQEASYREASYLVVALEAGQPCTQESFFSGECNDQLSAFAIESE